MPTRRHGFSFVELLFAMATLSFGLLGVAGALYVGLGQTQATVDDTQAAAVARQAAATLARVMTDKGTGATDLTFQSLLSESSDGLSPEALAMQQAIRGAQIVGDGEYAWVPIYRRSVDPLSGVAAKYAELVVVVVRSSARHRFDASDVQSFDPDTRTYPQTLAAVKGTVQIENNEAVIRTRGVGGRLGPGSAVVLAGMSDPRLTGRVIRLSESIGPDTWSLVPGQDVSDLPAANGGNAFVVGRGYADPKNPAGGYAGMDQVVSVYATLVTLN